jgi:hypothetical protein
MFEALKAKARAELAEVKPGAGGGPRLSAETKAFTDFYFVRWA